MLPVYEILKSDLTVKHNNYELDFHEHMHKYLEIIYVYEGVQGLKVDNRDYTLTKGCAAAIFPDTLHSYHSLDKKYADVLILMCDPKLFGNLLPKLSDTHPEVPCLCADNVPAAIKTAAKMIDPAQPFEIRFSWTCVIVTYILRALTLEKHTHQPVGDISYKIIKYIEENFTETITRGALAKQFNVSECYISRLFTQKFKMNLRNYLGMIRAEYAANLIRTTDENFTTICQQAGFESQRTFNRMFKAMYGCTPQEYKRNISKLSRNGKEE